MTMMATWTREELEQLSPFGEVLTGGNDGESRPMTREEYDKWIDAGVGVEKPEPEPEL